MSVPSIISGNLAASISDHLPQFLVAPNTFSIPIFYSKSNKYKRDWSKFDEEYFVLDYFSVDLDNLLLASNINTDKSYKTFLEKLNLYSTFLHF